LRSGWTPLSAAEMLRIIVNGGINGHANSRQ
jgi:hypothetical protein